MIQNKNLNFLGDNLFSDYMDILAKDNSLEIIDELIKAIANLDKWNKADLLNIPGTSNSLNLYESLFLKCTFSSKLKMLIRILILEPIQILIILCNLKARVLGKILGQPKIDFKKWGRIGNLK